MMSFNYSGFIKTKCTIKYLIADVCLFSEFYMLPLAPYKTCVARETATYVFLQFNLRNIHKYRKRE